MYIESFTLQLLPPLLCINKLLHVCDGLVGGERHKDEEKKKLKKKKHVLVCTTTRQNVPKLCTNKLTLFTMGNRYISFSKIPILFFIYL